MCCVMPPNSCSVTRVFRMASRSDVFPWSTCPMTVTTGDRGSSWEGSISSSRRPGSSGERISTSKPNRAATALVLSASSGWLIVAMTPMPTSSRMTSPSFLRMRSASSATVTSSARRSTSRGPASAAGAADAAAGTEGASAGTVTFSTVAAGAATRSASAGGAGAAAAAAVSSRRGRIGTTLPSAGAGAVGSAALAAGFSEGLVVSEGAPSRAAGTMGS